MLASCGEDTNVIVRLDGGNDRVEVARVPVTAKTGVDLLFQIDDSQGTLDKQTNLKDAFPAFLDELGRLDGGLPSLHIGVVTSDLGSTAADGSAGPDLTGTGGCVGNGKAGNLITNADVQGAFISDVKSSDGSRVTNYVGTLADAFTRIASVGSGGCGFEQPIEATRRALDNNPANAGFLRSDAALAIVVLADEDDCSFAHSTFLDEDTSTLGPRHSFRCTRFGVTCDAGGATPDEMNIVGKKNQCHSNEASPYVMPIEPYVQFFQGLEANPEDVMFAAIVGPAVPIEVELRAQPNSSMQFPALAQSCGYAGSAGTEVADPAVRITQLASRFTHRSINSVCNSDQTPALVDIARQVRWTLGDSCLTRAIAMPADCVVRDEVAASSTELPACDGGASSTNKPCYELVTDETSCTGGSHLRLQVQRDSAPPAEMVTVASCRI